MFFTAVSLNTFFLVLEGLYVYGCMLTYAITVEQIWARFRKAKVDLLATVRSTPILPAMVLSGDSPSAVDAFMHAPWPGKPRILAGSS